MTIRLTGIVLTLLASGCAISSTVGPGGAGAEMSLAEFNAEFLGESATVRLSDGQELSVMSPRVENDSLTWINHRTGEPGRTALDSVQRIVTKGHLLSGVAGFVVGTGLGAGIGLRIASDFEGDQATKRGYTLVYSTGSGAVLGTLIGILVGWPETYEFKPRGSTEERER